MHRDRENCRTECVHDGTEFVMLYCCVEFTGKTARWCWEITGFIITTKLLASFANLANEIFPETKCGYI